MDVDEILAQAAMETEAAAAPEPAPVVAGALPQPGLLRCPPVGARVSS